MKFTRTVTVYIDIDEIEKVFINENLNTKEELMDCIELHISYFDDCDYYLIDDSIIDKVYNTLLKREKIKKRINS